MMPVRANFDTAECLLSGKKGFACIADVRKYDLSAFVRVQTFRAQTFRVQAFRLKTLERKLLD